MTDTALMETAIKESATRLRINSIKATNASNSGHPTSCASAAEIMATLFLKEMRYKVKEPRDPNNDRFVLSKGHAAPVLYAAWADMGLIPASDLLNLRKIDSDLEGHPTPRLPFVDVATGSLGQGLSAAAGMAYTGKYFDKADYRVYCLMGDGESAEGSIWEAMSFASIYKLDNLVAIFDINRLGQSQPTAFGHDLELYRKRAEAFGFHSIVVDGHNISELLKAFEEARNTKDRPTAIIAKTLKGKDMSFMEDGVSWHGKPVGAAKEDEVVNALKASLITASGDDVVTSLAKFCPQMPSAALQEMDLIGSVKMSSPPAYNLGDSIATRAAYGTALAKLGAGCDRVVAMDGDTKNSTFSIKFTEKFPERFIEGFIAEQNLVGVGIGCATRGRTIPFVSTFAAFFSRAYDQLRMGAISQTNCNFCGSHAGVSIGEDGPSQMALEDLAMFRAIPGATVFYPSDAVSTEYAVQLAANTRGICFIRSGRPNCPVIYKNDEHFEVGKGKVVHSSGASSDVVTVVGAGITLSEAMKAARELAKGGINIRVIDPFTIKPIDANLLIQAAKETGGKVITVEDHYPEGGLGEAVLTALQGETGVCVKRLAVHEVPRSGKPEQLLAKYGIDCAAIVAAVKSVI